MQLEISLSGTRKIPVEVSSEVYERLLDANGEVQITLVASPTAFETPLDSGEQSSPLNVKCKIIAVERIKSSGL